MLEEKIARVKKLIEQREKIEAELGALFGINDAPKRGRPRKESGGGATEAMPAPQFTETGSAGT